MSADHLAPPNPGIRASSADRHLELCLSSDRVIEDSELKDIAGAIGDRWKDVGKHLRIGPEFLSYWERQHSESLRNRNAKLRMLYLWTQKHDKKATVSRLAKALCKAGELDAVRAIQQR
jgi:hypothetical protein